MRFLHAFCGLLYVHTLKSDISFLSKVCSRKWGLTWCIEPWESETVGWRSECSITKKLIMWLITNTPNTHQQFSSLHSDYPWAVTDHVTDLPEGVVYQSDLLIGGGDWNNTVNAQKQNYWASLLSFLNWNYHFEQCKLQKQEEARIDSIPLRIKLAQNPNHLYRCWTNLLIIVTQELTGLSKRSDNHMLVISLVISCAVELKIKNIYS